MARASGSGSRYLRWKWIAPVLALGVLLTAAYVWRATNVLGSGEVCGGLASTAAAQAAFPAAGRISDRDGLDSNAHDPLVFTCDVESSALLPGADPGHLKISGSRERGDFPFADARWPGPATVSFFSGTDSADPADSADSAKSDGATGGVGDGHGWVLLPAACTKDRPAIVEAYAPAGSDPVKLAALLTDVANRAAARAGCAADRPMAAPGTLAAAPSERPVPDGTLCGVPGLAFPGAGAGAGTGAGAARETLRDGTGPTWACEVKGRATYAVTREPRMLAAIGASPGYKEQPPVAGHRVSGFDPRHVVADCAGTPVYFSMELGRDYTSALGTPGTPTSQELFESFVAGVGKRFGCAAPTR